MSWPRSVPQLVRCLRQAGVPGDQMEFHPHNDTHLVVANSLSAVLAGCAVINGTLPGKGERTGNTPLEGVLLHLIGLGVTPAPDFQVLNELAKLYGDLGQGLPAKYPLYRSDAHRTRAGIHTDRLNMYAPFDVPHLLGRPLELSLTQDSGLAGLIFLIKSHTGRELSKDNPDLRSLHTVLQDEFEAGRQTAMEWEEIAERALKLDQEGVVVASRP